VPSVETGMSVLSSRRRDCDFNASIWQRSACACAGSSSSMPTPWSESGELATGRAPRTVFGRPDHADSAFAAENILDGDLDGAVASDVTDHAAASSILSSRVSKAASRVAISARTSSIRSTTSPIVSSSPPLRAIRRNDPTPGIDISTRGTSSTDRSYSHCRETV
jgi:hypothetical protein